MASNFAENLASSTSSGRVEGFAFEYAPRLTAFEFKNPSGNQSDKVVVFVAGLTDGLLTVPYLPKLSRQLDSIGWTLVQIIFSSSYIGWGTGSLARDAYEISLLVKHLRSSAGGSRSKVVLMGHSTGCQDTVQYLTRLENPTKDTEIDAGILQAPVSDREAIGAWVPLEKVAELNDKAKQFVAQGKEHDVLPREFSDAFLGAPLTAYRWLSFTQVGGDDDFFSSDLGPDRLKSVFGKIDKPLLVLYSGKDESVPSFVDKQKLIDHWKTFADSKVWSPLSKVVKGATHNVGPYSDAGAEDDVLKTVVEFVKGV